MTDEVMQTATPAEQVTAEQGAEVEQQVTPEATAEQTEQQAEQKEEAKKEPWFQKRIGELTREKYEARRAAEEAQKQAEQYRAYLAQLQQGEQQTLQQPQTQADLDRLAEAKAAQMLAERNLVEATNKVWAEGTKEFPNFDSAVANLQMVGMDRQFVELAVSTDAGHKVLHYLGQEANLDEAARILRLPPVQQARELTKLEFKLSQPPAPKPVSKAPAPISPIGTGKAVDGDLRDDLPIEEWVRRERERTRRK